MNIKKMVKKILTKVERLRGNDIHGFIHLNECLGKINVQEARALYEILPKCVNYESYRRARQFVQAENPELKPDKEVQEAREKEEKLMREWKGDVDKVNQYRNSL